VFLFATSNLFLFEGPHHFLFLGTLPGFTHGIFVVLEFILDLPEKNRFVMLIFVGELPVQIKLFGDSVDVFESNFEGLSEGFLFGDVEFLACEVVEEVVE
jgi:hypothetical protein